MIIIEGTDGVGKTTIQEKLLTMSYFQENGYRPGHFGILPSGFNYYWDYRAAMHRRLVQDRFHMSEFTYGAVCRKGSKIDKEKYRFVDAALRQLGAYTLLITAENDLIRERCENTPQHFDWQVACAVNHQFKHIALPNECLLDWDYHIHLSIKYPWVTDSQIAECIDQYLNRQDALCAVLERRPRCL